MLNYVILCISIQFSLSLETNNNQLEKLFETDEWDYILYSQRWPVTGCSEWKEKSSSNTCALPKDPKTWTVHGLWPTKTGTDGPNNCNSAIHFDPTQLQPMLNDLNEYWINVEANTKPNSFWKHEWDKHGTCAVSLPQLNSEYNYFQQGLRWNRQFRIDQLLSENQVVPNNDGYTIEHIYNTIRNATGKHPQVECIVDRKSKNSLISEIRICFDKNLELIDCINESNQPMLTNCNGKKPVMYYAAVPEIADDYDEEFMEECVERHKYNNQLMRFYAVVKFLMWLTL